MKVLIIVFVLLIGFETYGQTKDVMLNQIEQEVQYWKSVIDQKLPQCTKFYNYAWGANYEHQQLVTYPVNEDTVMLSEMISIIPSEERGFFVQKENYSFSGDWFILADYYYDQDKLLYYIFWRMNTFYAEKPITVEKKMYFSPKGEPLDSSCQVYRMNTRDTINVNFMDQEVQLRKKLVQWDFYSLWHPEEAQQ
ncbi:MAG: hypothetical protein ACNS62_07665 [Candidatus Cyclobacteriaceae bacterium M3_2C_046]